MKTLMQWAKMVKGDVYIQLFRNDMKECMVIDDLTNLSVNDDYVIAHTLFKDPDIYERLREDWEYLFINFIEQVSNEEFETKPLMFKIIEIGEPVFRKVRLGITTHEDGLLHMFISCNVKPYKEE